MRESVYRRGLDVGRARKKDLTVIWVNEVAAAPPDAAEIEMQNEVFFDAGSGYGRCWSILYCCALLHRLMRRGGAGGCSWRRGAQQVWTWQGGGCYINPVKRSGISAAGGFRGWETSGSRLTRSWGRSAGDPERKRLRRGISRFAAGSQRRTVTATGSGRWLFGGCMRREAMEPLCRLMPAADLNQEAGFWPDDRLFIVRIASR